MISFFSYYFHWLALFDETWQTSWPWCYWPLWLPKNYHPSLGFISFTLPMHKADWFFKGSTIMLEQHASLLDPLPVFQRYLTSCNQLFGPLPELWLKSDSCVPMRSWFISKLKKLFPEEDVSGHSLWSGGTTALALAGVLLNRIQLISHWPSKAFYSTYTKIPYYKAQSLDNLLSRPWILHLNHSDHHSPSFCPLIPCCCYTPYSTRATCHLKYYLAPWAIFH